MKNIEYYFKERYEKSIIELIFGFVVYGVLIFGIYLFYKMIITYDLLNRLEFNLVIPVLIIMSVSSPIILVLQYLSGNKVSGIDEEFDIYSLKS